MSDDDIDEELELHYRAENFFLGIDEGDLVVALDVMGWKIVDKEGDTRRWRFDSETADYPCPDWCEDSSRPPRREPRLRLVE
jgi:hypothetical protein